MAMRESALASQRNGEDLNRSPDMESNGTPSNWVPLETNRRIYWPEGLNGGSPDNILKARGLRVKANLRNRRLTQEELEEKKSGFRHGLSPTIEGNLNIADIKGTVAHAGRGSPAILSRVAVAYLPLWTWPKIRSVNKETGAAAFLEWHYASTQPRDGIGLMSDRCTICGWLTGNLATMKQECIKCLHNWICKNCTDPKTGRWSSRGCEATQSAPARRGPHRKAEEGRAL